MRVSPRQIEQAADAWAQIHGHEGRAQIPSTQREDATQAIAYRLGIDAPSVALVLACQWNETAGLQGAGASGANIASVSSTTQSKSDSVRLRCPPKAPPAPAKIERRGDRIDTALQADGSARIYDESCPTMVANAARRGVSIDQHIDARVGDIRLIDFTKIADDDPALDAPLYRCMTSQDPTVHAALLTGRMIPQGKSGDYDGFKRYDHKTPIDAYEWSLDPYVALRYTGGHGYMVRTTLRELRDAGAKDVARMVGDSEGGFFIASVFEPNVRQVSHLKGCFELGPVLPPVRHERAKPFASHLANRVPGAGGWDEFIDAGSKGSTALRKVKVRMTVEQAHYWAKRVAELDPDSALPAQVDKRLAGLPDDPKRAQVIAKRVVDALKMKFANLDEPPADDAYTLIL